MPLRADALLALAVMATGCEGLFGVDFDDAHPQDDDDHQGGAGGSGGSAMDSKLVLSNPASLRCMYPGIVDTCPPGQMCHIAGPDSGTCEGCVTCGHLGDPCTVNIDCDTLFQCYAGKCTQICLLGTVECGAIADCLYVGNVYYGVCKPI
jgi:hypothetical protein